MYRAHTLAHLCRYWTAGLVFHVVCYHTANSIAPHGKTLPARLPATSRPACADRACVRCVAAWKSSFEFLHHALQTVRTVLLVALAKGLRDRRCQLIGGSGRYQGGIDLFAYARDDKAQLTVFECKCWKEFKAAALKNAVAHFLDRPWSTPGVRFVLILAQDSLEQFGEAWNEAGQALRARQIVGEVWTAMDLTERIRLHPDILVRFFPDATVTTYCSERMRRVDFWTQLQKYRIGRIAVFTVACGSGCVDFQSYSCYTRARACLLLRTQVMSVVGNCGRPKVLLLGALHVLSLICHLNHRRCTGPLQSSQLHRSLPIYRTLHL